MPPPATGICAICEQPSVTTLPIKLALQAATRDLAYATSRLPFCQDCLDRISNPRMDGTERVMGLALQSAALRLHTRVTNDLFEGNHTMAGQARARERAESGG